MILFDSAFCAECLKKIHTNLKMRIQIIPVLLALVVVLTLNSCRIPNSAVTPPENKKLKTSTKIERPDVPRLREPFEVWDFGRDLDRNRLDQRGIGVADELVREGRRREALDRYLSLRSPILIRSDKIALELRIASTQLALGDPTAALDTLTAVYREQKKGVGEVNAPYSLIFAYAYGQKGNFDQSLAWFAKVERITKGSGVVGQAVSYGMRALVRTMPSGNLASSGASFGRDSFVGRFISSEQERRRTATYSQQSVGDAFWRTNTSTVAPPRVTESGVARVGVMLPLTGKFSKLGQSTRNGIELVSKSGSVTDVVSFSYKDTGGSDVEAEALLRELVEMNSASVVLGPLLSGPSISVSSLARESGIPLLTFSKKNKFPVGDGVFRIGPTVSSQVDSLINGCAGSLGARKFALVFAENDLGYEFADTFRRRVKELGLEIAYSASYPPGDNSSFVVIAEEIEATDATAVFLPDNLRVASRFITSASAALRRRVRFVGPASWYNPRELANAQQVFEGVVLVSPFYAESNRPIVGDFVQAYRKQYGSDPDFLAAQGFDAATMLVAAQRRAAIEGIAFRDAFYGIREYEGLTGKITVDAGGEVRRLFEVVEFQGDSIESLGVGSSAIPTFVYRGNSLVSEDIAKGDSSSATRKPSELGTALLKGGYVERRRL